MLIIDAIYCISSDLIESNHDLMPVNGMINVIN